MVLEEELPFRFSDELPCDVPSLDIAVPKTLVNTRPLTGTPFIAPFVPCPDEVISQALSFALSDFIGEKEVLMDLGCGDGRILVEAVKRYHQRLSGVIGVELDPYLAQHARQNLSDSLLKVNLKGSGLFWQVHEQDMFALDRQIMQQSTIMILYLLPAGLDKLQPVLEEWFLMNPSKNRLITIDYEIPWTTPVKSVAVFQLKSRSLKLHFYGAFDGKVCE